MNHQETLEKWKGQAPIEPGMKHQECVYWPKIYCKERGYPIQAFGGSAINGWNTGSPFDDTWVRVLKTKTNAPKEGDIIFWSTNRCTNGHVAIASKYCNPLLFRFTDMNGTGRRDPIQSRWESPLNVLGWFTKK